ncbi:MAG TPA: LuxR C-terminal-related transcriptional regulator [Roseiflexaceae bacterium]|nr:LuxR C-terminal-related transcriptional regulator [Roseiflexaceae bacterium]
MLYNGAMPTPVIAAKLFIPPPRPNGVPRSRLIARLNEGLQRRLTLISAPAGFGKTSLASAWTAGCGRPAAWLSLDEGDNEPSRFLRYLVAALQTLAPTIGTDVAEQLQSSQPPPIEALLPLLLNAIATLPQPAVLVLDDYHLLEASSIDQALAVLVEHLPPQLHLVIATREDPPLPLARLRARGQLTELRAADLRFTPAEATAFLNQVMGLSLSTEDIAALEDRTEGWIAGLQLAALSMQGHRDVSNFIRAFAGNHRYIVDYLVEEVLQRQPEAVRSFLLQTAILDRLTGPLCDAVSGQEHGSARLEALHRGNFFVVPLDDTRQWYRYHRLFADALSAQLMAEQPDQVATLHRRASAWHEQHGALADAIRHALAAQNFARAANLVELAAPAMSRSRQEATLLGWLKALPDQVVASRPVLSVQYAGTLLSVGELEGVDARLGDAERWLELMAKPGEQPGVPSAEMVVVDQAAFRQLPGSIAVYRAGQSLARGNPTDTITYTRRALDLLSEDDHVMRGAAHALLGLASWTIGDLESAYRSYSDGMARLQKAGHIADAIGGAITPADILIVQGRLREAARIYERGLQLAADHGAPQMRGTADMYVGLSELSREHGELHAAMQLLLRSQEQGEHTGFPQHPYRWRVALARIREAQGDLEGALDLLQEAERRYASDFSPNVRPVAAWKTRVWLAQGRLDDALGWAREQGLGAYDELSYLREFEHITLARVLLACSRREPAGGSLREAIELLQRLLHAAESGGRTASVIEILVLLSLAHQMQGNIPAALLSLSRALALAEPASYVRMFVDGGPAMRALLQEALARGTTGYVETLLAAFPAGGAAGSMYPTATAHHLVEPLSDREREVLGLLRTDLDGPEIAGALTISLNTLRTHTKNIYSKLGVSNRRAAVRRAEELDL